VTDVEVEKEHFKDLTPEERREVLQSLPTEELLNLFSAEELQRLRNHPNAGSPAQPRKPRWRK